MTTTTRAAALTLLMLAALASGGGAPAPVEGARRPELLGACYCRAAGTLECTAGLSESECRRRCDEALCDEWFWKERLPCWNWGYGG
jgi:hypothetical protein